jgi:hypothetical protein
MADTSRSDANGSHDPLPKPNVVVVQSGTPMHELTPEAVRGMVINPIYAGVGPFPRMVEDDAWVHACARLIDEEGPTQFLVNLLFVLRKSIDEKLLRELYGS